jgi:ZIP family zinc transporter
MDGVVRRELTMGTSTRVGPVAEPGASGAGLAVIPLLGLAAVVAVLLVIDPVRSLTDTTPVESVAVERTRLEPGRIEMRVRNSGRTDLTLAQVIVNDAFWRHTITDRDLGRLDAATVTISYPWEQGIPVRIALVTRSGTVIDHVIDSPSTTPEPGLSTAGTLGLVGVLMAPVPVALGLAWLRVLRRSSRTWFGAAVAFSLGLLAFLLVDSTAEGLEAAAEAPAVLDGVGLFAVGAVLGGVAVSAIGWTGGSRRSGGPVAGIRLACLVAIGIGLHNLGEGLAVGAAVSTGEVALGTALVVGFAVHNLTEGVAIAGPLGTATGTRAGTLAALVAVAALPVLPGLWVGSFVLPTGWASLAFGVAAGAILQVVWAVGLWLRQGTALTPTTAAAFAAAVVLLYLTGLTTA